MPYANYSFIKITYTKGCPVRSKILLTFVMQFLGDIQIS